MKHFIAALSFALTAGMAQAAVLDFTGNICSGGPCNSWDTIDQSYGDAAGVEVSYDGNIAAAGLQDLQYWTSYSDLNGVAWGVNGATAEVRLEAVGSSITLLGFDLGSYLSTNRTSRVQIFEIGNPTALLTNDPITVGATHTSYDALNFVSNTGFLIQWGPDAYDVGIDNIAFNVGAPIPSVPLPASGLLLAGSLFGLRRLRRRPI